MTEPAKRNTKRIASDLKSKAEVIRHWRDMLDSPLTMRIYAYRNKITIDSFILGVKKWLPDEWEAKRGVIGPIAEKNCNSCGLIFYPRNGLQQYCGQACRDKGWHTKNPQYRISRNEKRKAIRSEDES